jgi:GTPase
MNNESKDKTTIDDEIEISTDVSFEASSHDEFGSNLVDEFFNRTRLDSEKDLKPVPKAKARVPKKTILADGSLSDGSPALRCGYVSVIGLPNAGKSTLVNRVIGEQVSIVSPKAQTTRQCVTGIYTKEDTQIIFVDAPGFIQAETGLNHFIQRQWEESVRDCDVVLGVLNLDCDTEDKISNAILTLASINKPKFAFINKVDLIKYAERLFIIEQKLRDHNIEYIFGSAKTASKENIETLIENLAKRLPETDSFMFDKSLYTLQTEKEIAAEVIREKCFNLLGQEIPYQMGVNIIAFDEESKCTKIYADIWISKERYKKIVVGQKGSKILEIGTESRKDIERILGHQIYLNLKVKLKESWTKNPNMLKELGYELRK